MMDFGLQGRTPPPQSNTETPNTEHSTSEALEASKSPPASHNSLAILYKQLQSLQQPREPILKPQKRTFEQKGDASKIVKAQKKIEESSSKRKEIGSNNSTEQPQVLASSSLASSSLATEINAEDNQIQSPQNTQPKQLCLEPPTITWISNMECADLIFSHLEAYWYWQKYMTKYRNKTKTAFEDNKMMTEQATNTMTNYTDDMVHVFGMMMIDDLVKVDVCHLNMKDMLEMTARKKIRGKHICNDNDVCIKLDQMMKKSYEKCNTPFTKIFVAYIKDAAERILNHAERVEDERQRKKLLIEKWIADCELANRPDEPSESPSKKS